MVTVIIIVVLIILLAVFACCKAASKADEEMCPMIDITKGCCQVCLIKEPYYHFNIGCRQIHLCKECFGDFAKQLNEFCRNEKLEV